MFNKPNLPFLLEKMVQLCGDVSKGGPWFSGEHLTWPLLMVERRFPDGSRILGTVFDCTSASVKMT